MRLGLAALALCLGAAPAAALSADFDGDWQVSARTTVGDCAPEVSGMVSVQGGHVVASSAPGVAAWGYIEDGVVSARFTQGQRMARANGKLKSAGGSGVWSSNTDYCGGTWTARKAD
jgi:hypothetical protein